MITTDDASLPVTGEPGDPDFGPLRVCQYHDPDTGSLMYRIEKESSAPDDEAELIAIHVNAAYAKRLLAYIQSQEGGGLGAKGCLLLIRGATLASDGAVTVAAPETPWCFPDPRRPTRYNHEGSPDWQADQSQEGATDAVIVFESPASMPKDEADTAPPAAQDSLF